MLKILFSIFYYICIAYFLFYEFMYLYLKLIKKDNRLKGVSFFKFLLNTREIMKGE